MRGSILNPFGEPPRVGGLCAVFIVATGIGGLYYQESMESARRSYDYNAPTVGFVCTYKDTLDYAGAPAVYSGKVRAPAKITTSFRDHVSAFVTGGEVTTHYVVGKGETIRFRNTSGCRLLP